MPLYSSVWSCDRLNNKDSENLWLKVCCSVYYHKNNGAYASRNLTILRLASVKNITKICDNRLCLYITSIFGVISVTFNENWNLLQ